MRPREGHDVWIERGRIEIEPEATVRWLRDVYGNSVAIITFAEPSPALRILSVQLPHETLALGSGSCRDYAVLMMEAARHWGFGARFVTGYIQMGEGQHGATYAWTEIYLPGAGWHGFDPTNNKRAGTEHISVAVAREQEKASPLAGSWDGPSGAFDRMQVSVQVVAR